MTTPQNNIMRSTCGAAITGATIENIFRQPLTAVTIVMINQKKGLYEAFISLYREGGLSRFYNGAQGFAISWLMRTSHRITTFGINQNLHSANYSNTTIALATTIAEFGTTAFGELVLTLAQTPQTKSTPLQIIKKRYQQRGFSSLTTGFLGNSARNIIFNGLLFGIKNNSTDSMKKHAFSMSAIITLVAVITSHPPEVIRARKVDAPSKSYIQIIKSIYSESSFKGFSKGLVPRIGSVGIGTFIMMLTFTHLTNKN
jgi:hypothetical protein